MTASNGYLASSRHDERSKPNTASYTLASAGHVLARELACVVPKSEDLEDTPPRPEDLPRYGHSPDFRSARHKGILHKFTSAQAVCVEILWTEWKKGTPEVGDGYLLEKAGAGGKQKLRDVFKGNPAWKTMIVPGEKTDTHRIADVPEE